MPVLVPVLVLALELALALVLLRASSWVQVARVNVLWHCNQRAALVIATGDAEIPVVLLEGLIR